jgi:hypothetical protein
MNEKLVTAVDFILDRLKERSTWRGIVFVLGGAGMTLEPEQWESIVAFGMVLFGLVDSFWPEPKQ